MNVHGCTVSWQREGAPFLDRRYSRAHTWRFDGGQVVPASASPHVVPPPFSDPCGVDPEEAFVAAVSSCHMLTFLWLAAGRGLVVDSYADAAVGHMGPNAQGREAVTTLVLRPRVGFAPPRTLDADELRALHGEAHALCFIANSITSEVRVEPVA